MFRGLVVIAMLSACGGTSQNPSCGDGIVQPTEVEACEFGPPMTCEGLGLAGGPTPVPCTAACQADVTVCDGCGNERLDEGEQCDGPDTGEATCTSLGFEGGTLACAMDCTLDESGCTGGAAATVEVTKNGLALPNAPVAVADATGQSVSSHATGADGKVAVAVGADHMVTVGFTRESGQRDVRTVQGVQPGDLVHVDFFELPPTDITQKGQIATTFTAAPLAGATTNTSENGCVSNTTSASSTTPHNQNVFGFCADANGRGERLSQQFDAQGNLLGFDYRSALVLDPQTPTPAPVAAWTTDLAPLTCELANTPAVADVDLAFTAQVGIIRNRPFATLIISPPAGGTITRTRQIPNDAAVTNVGCSFALPDERQCSDSSSPPGSFTFTGDQFLGALSAVAIDSTAAPRYAMTWTQGAGGPADFTAAQIFFTNGTTQQLWSVTAPGDATSIEFPALPDDAAWESYDVTDQTVVNSSNAAFKIEHEAFADYDAVKASIGATPGTGRRCSSAAFTGN